MTAAKLKIPAIEKGATYRHRLIWKGSNGQFIDLTDCTAKNYSWTASFKTPPASANAAGSSGTILWGSDGYLYLCIATDTWIRTQLTTWS